MDLRTIATGLAANRVAFGVGFMLAPGLGGRAWLGPAGRSEATKVFARALGARDLALGVGALLSLDDPERAGRWFQGQALADFTDFAATLLAGGRIPLPNRLFALSMAAGSAAVAAAYALDPR